MLDIGFFELLLVAVMGLFVVGPERLPSVIRACGLYWGRIKYQWHTTKASLAREIGLDEVKNQLHNEAVLAQEKQSGAASAIPNKKSLPYDVQDIVPPDRPS